MMIRVHLDSIARITISIANEQLVGPWLVLAARQAQLDVRFVVEELMLLSIAAHQEAGRKISRKLRKAYQDGVVAKELTQLNPNYFRAPLKIALILTAVQTLGQCEMEAGCHGADGFF